MRTHTFTPVLLGALFLASSGSQSLATTNYVDLHSTTPVAPYLSWNTAATNIQDATDVTADGDTVLVNDGIYYLDKTIIITNAITLRSLNLRGAIIDGDQGFFGVRCLNLGSSACSVERFTIQHGWVPNLLPYSPGKGGGIYCSNNTPRVVSCLMMYCSAAYGGGMYQGRSENCTFNVNSAHFGGGQYGGLSYQSSFVYNRATSCNAGISGRGGGMQSGTAYNCLFLGNESVLGGGLDSSTAYNCTIVANVVKDVYFDGSLYYGDGGGTRNATVCNSIVYDNTDNSYQSDCRTTAGFYSCSPDLTHDVDGCITNDPAFVPQSAWWDYRLSSNSPCINAGNNASVTTSVDWLNSSRIIDLVVDMGAFESSYENRDTDHDGILDSWEVIFFGHPSNCVATIDFDGDGHNNLQEFICGTDPTNSASYFMVENGSPYPDVPERFVLEWTSVSGRVYRALWSASLTNRFSPLETGMDYPRNSCTDSVHVGEATGFYCLEVERVIP